MKDYFPRDGGRLKKFGLRKKVIRSMRQKLLMEIIWNPIMRILTKIDSLSKIWGRLVNYLVPIKKNHPKWLPE